MPSWRSVTSTTSLATSWTSSASAPSVIRAVASTIRSSVPRAIPPPGLVGQRRVRARPSAGGATSAADASPGSLGAASLARRLAPRSRRSLGRELAASPLRPARDTEASSSEPSSPLWLIATPDHDQQHRQRRRPAPARAAAGPSCSRSQARASAPTPAPRADGPRAEPAVAREPGRGPLVEPPGELGLRLRPLRAQLALQLLNPHRTPPSASRSPGAAWCRRSTR